MTDMTTLVASNEDPEVLAHLVVAAVFKTVGTCVNRRSGGFDSHALPLSGAIGSTSGLSAKDPNAKLNVDRFENETFPLTTGDTRLSTWLVFSSTGTKQRN